MSTPKIYKNNENGMLAFATKIKYKKEIYYRGMNEIGVVFEVDKIKFEDQYTLIQDVIPISDAVQAVMWLEQGKAIRPKSLRDKERRFILKKGKGIDAEIWCESWGKPYNNDYFVNELFSCEWELYEESQVIIEKLPHEFKKGEKVLVRWVGFSERKWIKQRFICFDKDAYICETRRDSTYFGVAEYCIPYKGNEHLEGQVTDGEHGKIPENYMPPHVPKLGDEDYWQVGDKVIDLGTGKNRKILKINGDWVILCHEYGDRVVDSFMEATGADSKALIRIWFHAGSYIKEDGTVHEFVPTRPYNIS